MSRTRGTAEAISGAYTVTDGPSHARTYPHPAAALPGLVWRASGAGEWPVGIHWSPGEVREIPPGYPITEPVPAWVEVVE